MLCRVKIIPFYSITGLLMKTRKLTSPSSFSLVGRSLGVKVGIDGELIPHFAREKQAFHTRLIEIDSRSPESRPWMVSKHITLCIVKHMRAGFILPQVSWWCSTEEGMKILID